MRSRVRSSSQSRHNNKTSRKPLRTRRRTRGFVMETLEERCVLSATWQSDPDALALVEGGLPSGAAAQSYSSILEELEAKSEQSLRFTPLPEATAPLHGPSAGGSNATSANAPFPLEDTFFLNSRPNATKTIYLDFNGHVTTGTDWNTDFTDGAPITTPAYDFDGNRNAFSEAELTRIQEIWEQVSEDFLPFDVNVTTEDPGIQALQSTGGTDTEWGIRVAIGGDYTDWLQLPAGGIAYLTSFNDPVDTPTFVFPDALNSGEVKATAEAITHEVGHTLGLSHDGTALEDYYEGHGTGPTSWAPIMGVGYYVEVVQWSKGEYTSASQVEDDLLIITTDNGFGYREDDHHSDSRFPSPLLFNQVTGLLGEGIIERNTDLDFFYFEIGDGAFDLQINPFYRSPNLDILATLYDTDGNVVATSNPAGSLAASFQMNLSAGRYLLAIDGTGDGDVLGTGYSDYGSLGYYSISGVLPDPVPSATLSGFAWEDENANGRRDAEEQNLAGWEVFLDANSNGALDSGEETALTASDGSYSFAVEVPGTYRVAQVMQAGYERTFPGGDGTHLVDATAERSYSGLNFGVRTARATISGVVFNDFNQDGQRDDGENGLAGMTVYLDANNDRQLGLGELAVVTDSSGEYRFTDLRAGSYVVREALRPGWFQSTPEDPNGGPNEGFGYSVAIGQGEVTSDLDFGNYATSDDGNAPSPYASSGDQGGPVHGVLRGFQLGAQNHVEDGVRFLTGLHAGATEQVSVDVSFGGFPRGLLQGWIDFNADGDFNDSGEQIIKDRSVTEGSNLVSFQVPAGVNLSPGITPHARFRLGYERGISASAAAMAGEVEDYAVSFPLTPDTGLEADSDSYTLDEDAPATPLNVLANDTLGPGGGTLTVTAISAPAHGTAVIAQGGTQITYQPDPNYNGPDDFTYTVTDGQGGVQTATVSITVNPVNDPPAAVNDQFSVVSDTSEVLDVLANDLQANTQIDGNEILTITAFSTPDQGGAVTIINGGTAIEYTPAPGFAGTETFTYTVTDDQGATATATVSIDVAPLVDEVRFRVVTTDLAGNEIDSLEPGEEFLVQVYVTDIRPTAYGVVTAYLDLLFSETLVSPTGVITYGPEYNGEATFDTSPGIVEEIGAITFNPLGGSENLLLSVEFIADASGIAVFSADPDESTINEITVFNNPAAGGQPTVVPVEQVDFGGDVTLRIAAFNANDDLATAIEGGPPIWINVLDNDTLGPDGGTKTIAGFTTPAVGTLEQVGNQFRYTPPSGFTGTTSFTYQFSDGLGNVETATVSITVRLEVNLPDALDDEFGGGLGGITIEEDDPDGVILPVLDNDLPNAGGTLVITSTTQPANGTVSVSGDGQTLIYTPDANFDATDTFTYTIVDGIGAPDTATVTVHVTGINDAPTATDDFKTVQRDSQNNTLDVINGDANSAADSDPEGDDLTIDPDSLTAPSQGGTVSVLPGGKLLSYTPPANFSGTETFSYTILDGNGGSDTATVTVEVRDVPHVDFELQLTDLSGNPIPSNEILVGATFRLNVYVQDVSPADVGGGVAKAYLDVTYDEAVLNVNANSFTHGSEYGGFEQQALFASGEINETGSVADDFGSTNPNDWPGKVQHLLYSVEFTASQAGQVTFASNPADETTSLSVDPVLLFGSDFAVDPSQINFGSTTLTVVASPFVNLSNPYDVNGNGRVTTLDALLVINDLVANGARQLSLPAGSAAVEGASAATPRYLVDTNADGRVTVLDALRVINELVRQVQQRQAEAELAATIEPAAPARTAVVSAPLTVSAALPASEPADEAQADWGIVASHAATTVTASTSATVTTASEQPTAADPPPRQRIVLRGATPISAVETVFSEPDSTAAEEDELGAIVSSIADDVAVVWKE